MSSLLLLRSMVPAHFHGSELFLRLVRGEERVFCRKEEEGKEGKEDWQMTYQEICALDVSADIDFGSSSNSNSSSIGSNIDALSATTTAFSPIGAPPHMQPVMSAPTTFAHTYWQDTLSCPMDLDHALRTLAAWRFPEIPPFVRAYCRRASKEVIPVLRMRSRTDPFAAELLAECLATVPAEIQRPRRLLAKKDVYDDDDDIFVALPRAVHDEMLPKDDAAMLLAVCAMRRHRLQKSSSPTPEDLRLVADASAALAANHARLRSTFGAYTSVAAAACVAQNDRLWVEAAAAAPLFLRQLIMHTAAPCTDLDALASSAAAASSSNEYAAILELADYHKDRDSLRWAEAAASNGRLSLLSALLLPCRHRNHNYRRLIDACVPGNADCLRLVLLLVHADEKNGDTKGEDDEVDDYRVLWRRAVDLACSRPHLVCLRLLHAARPDQTAETCFTSSDLAAVFLASSSWSTQDATAAFHFVRDRTTTTSKDKDKEKEQYRFLPALTKFVWWRVCNIIKS